LPKLVAIPENLQGLTRFNVDISDVEPINDLFSKCFIKILYPGLNRNNVYIEKTVADEMAKTLYNIPIVGEYLETIEDFKDHGGKIEITTDDIKFIQTTKPYGFVPEGSQIAWQNITEEDGTTREYLTCTGYLWTGRYPEVTKVIQEGRPQSMELDEHTLEGYWEQKGEDTFFHITEAKFAALCILGNDVPPAFESANIGSYYVSNPIAFSKQLGKLIRSLEESLDNDQVVNFAKKNDEEKGKSQRGGSDMLQFKLNLDEDHIRHQVYELLNVQEDDQREWKYSIIQVDTENEKVLYVEEQTGKFYSRSYVIEDNKISFTGETSEIQVGVIDEDSNDIKEEIEKYEQANADLSTRIEQLEQENAQLQEFKLEQENTEKQAVIDKYSKMLSEEEIEPFTSKITEFTKEQLEEKLAVLAIEKVNFSKESEIILDKFNDDAPGWVKIIRKHESQEN